MELDAGRTWTFLWVLENLKTNPTAVTWFSYRIHFSPTLISHFKVRPSHHKGQIANSKQDLHPVQIIQPFGKDTGKVDNSVGKMPKSKRN